MSEARDQVLMALAHAQDSAWERDAKLFDERKLELPTAYIVWAWPDGGSSVEAVSIGQDPAAWPFELVRQSTNMGGDATAFMTVGMGTMVSLERGNQGAETLMSLSAGLRVSDIPEAREHLISHLKTIHTSLPNRVMGAAVQDDGKLGPVVDSGFGGAIVDGAG